MASGRVACVCLFLRLLTALGSRVRVVDLGQLERPPQKPPETLASLNALQWNVHGECFSDAACRGEANLFLARTLQDPTMDLDMAGLQGFNDLEFHKGTKQLAQGWDSVRYQCGGLVRYPTDSAALLFNTVEWEAPLRSDFFRSGCFEHVERSQAGKWVAKPSQGASWNYRAFLVQVLQRRGTTERIVAVVSHHPHPPANRKDKSAVAAYDSKMAALKAAVGSVMTASRAQKLVLMADTNVGGQMPDDRVIAGFLIGARDAEGTRHHATCCAFEYTAIGFDRVIVAGFQGTQVETVLPFGGSHPPFAARNMHDPIVGKITYRAPPPQAGPQTRG